MNIEKDSRKDAVANEPKKMPETERSEKMNSDKPKENQEPKKFTESANKMAEEPLANSVQ